MTGQFPAPAEVLSPGPAGETSGSSAKAGQAPDTPPPDSAAAGLPLRPGVNKHPSVLGGMGVRGRPLPEALAKKTELGRHKGSGLFMSGSLLVQGGWGRLC